MSPIQIVLILFFLFAIGKVIGRYRSADLTVRELVFWVVLWLAAGVVAVLPESTSHLAELVGVGRGADLVVYFALAALFFIAFRLMVRHKRLEKEITVLTRQLTLVEQEKKDTRV